MHLTDATMAGKNTPNYKMRESLAPSDRCKSKLFWLLVATAETAA
jgi:hypothetical protein